jgi:hypothetical protein
LALSYVRLPHSPFAANLIPWICSASAPRRPLTPLDLLSDVSFVLCLIDSVRQDCSHEPCFDLLIRVSPLIRTRSPRCALWQPLRWAVYRYSRARLLPSRSSCRQ